MKTKASPDTMHTLFMYSIDSKETRNSNYLFDLFLPLFLVAQEILS